MKTKRRLSVIMACSLIIVFLAACAQPGSPEGNQATQSNEVEEVVVGVLAPLTGPAAQFGVAVHQGIELYVNQFNALGGLQVRLEVFDEEGDPTMAITGYHDLFDRGITALIGSVTSVSTLAVVPEAYADNMPMITATSTHAAVTFDAETGQRWSNVFRSCFIDPFQGYVMANFAVDEVGAQTAAILFNNETDYSIGLMEAFTQQAEARGLEIVAVEQFGNATTDFLGQLTNIAGVNPDVLFVPAYYEDIVLIGPQSLNANLEAVMLGADGWEGVLNVIANASSIEGAFYMTGFSVDDPNPMVQEFIATYEAAFGSAPNMFAAQAYDAAMILIASLEQALADGYLPNTAEFKASTISHMANTSMQAVTGYITFDEFNNPQKTAFIIEVVDGEPVLWGTF